VRTPNPSTPALGLPARDFGSRPTSAVQPSRHTTARTRAFGAISGAVEDAVLLLLIVFLFPVVILLIGAPLALLVQAVLSLSQQFF
jgi:hypothetical protein